LKKAWKGKKSSISLQRQIQLGIIDLYRRVERLARWNSSNLTQVKVLSPDPIITENINLIRDEKHILQFRATVFSILIWEILFSSSHCYALLPNVYANAIIPFTFRK